MDGDLVEVQAGAVQITKREEQRECDTEEQLYQLGKKRGYKHPRRWAKHIMQSRTANRIGRRRRPLDVWDSC